MTHELGPLHDTELSEVRNDAINQTRLSETGAAYFGSNWREVRKLYTAEQMRAYALAEVEKAVKADALEIATALKTACAEAFGSGPFHVERRTNAHAEICDAAGRAVAQCSWSTNANERALALCNLLNVALGYVTNTA